MYAQPPSGGCVLKQNDGTLQYDGSDPAAFGRLCVETVSNDAFGIIVCPAAFGRLCVETYLSGRIDFRNQIPSRLRAAVC